MLYLLREHGNISKYNTFLCHGVINVNFMIDDNYNNR